MKKICPLIMKVCKMKRIKRPVEMTLKEINKNRMMVVVNIVMVPVIGRSITMMSQMK
jgi:hypothetical protein